MLKLKNITKDYVAGDSTVTALKGVSIDFRDSEFVSILGPSGCGKTTLLNIIGGLDRYTSGDLVIEGRSTKEFSDRDWDSYRNHSVGFVFQSYNLIPHQTVLANVELALTLSGVAKSERRRRAEDALKQVGLGDQLHKRPNQLSGGQMQRVAIARALVNDPEILLADEPTGALDSATSVQIMEILKEIAKDRLIIMVTHNPELAEEYSTRIVRLLDGEIQSDTNPYDGTSEKKPENAAGKTSRTSMSFATALGLSLNNLMTKKGRTLLTSFAGSIGIIGIALILSLSAGVQAYIDRVEEDTLSSYPIQLTKATMDYSGMMMSLMELGENREEHELDRIYSNTIMSEMLNSMVSEVKTNNLEAFMKHLETHPDVPSLVSDIRYSYSTTMHVYASDTSEKIVQVQPSTVFENMGSGAMNEQMSGSMGQMSGGSAGMDVWTEMMDNPELLAKQYDVIAGRMPEAYNEVVLIVSKDNEVSDYTLYALGLKDQAEVKENFQKLMRGEKIVSEAVSFSYEDILNLSFRLLLNTDYYEKTASGWEDKRDDDAYMKKKLAEAEEICVVGIIRPSEGSNMGQVSGSIGYMPSLMLHLIDEVNKSEIVRAQKENPDVDVFTGITFEKPEKVEITMESMQAYIASLPAEEGAQYTASIAQMKAGGMSDEQILAMFASAMQPKTTDATYEGNLALLGVSDPENPSMIMIFPKDFEAKETLSAIIDAYNESVEEEDRIQYTDYIGLLLSSVTTVINAISYILIAFVAISLVVSSIMIGIITYISVLERTKEIGILRAVGASKKDISRVFNAETISVGFVAGAIGIIVTVILDIIASIVLEIITDIPGLASLPVVGGVALVVISMLLTYIAGLIPAKVAAKKDPVVALRSE
ncbi:MAG: ATP-binding cassette domain-containing protein [Ruminococcaceae bacterium]|nr:ATP-binding cassette domain-containing protein [Oscillospiraceae bacterium]